MAGEMFNVLFEYLKAGEFRNFFVALFNDYFPYGLLFWLIGFAVFLMIHYKTRNFAFSGAVATVYFLVISSSGFVTGIYVKSAMQFFGIILGILTGYYIYKSIKG